MIFVKEMFAEKSVQVRLDQMKSRSSRLIDSLFFFLSKVYSRDIGISSTSRCSTVTFMLDKFSGKILDLVIKDA